MVLKKKNINVIREQKKSRENSQKNEGKKKKKWIFWTLCTEYRAQSIEHVSIHHVLGYMRKSKYSQNEEK